MARVEEVIEDNYGFVYEVVSSYRNGYKILYQVEGATPCPWIIREPNGYMQRFRSEVDLWHYAINKNILEKERKDDLSESQ